MIPSIDPVYIAKVVRDCLMEDIGTGDLTAELTANTEVQAELVSRQSAVVCGLPFFNEVYLQLSSEVSVEWQVEDGDTVDDGHVLCRLTGPARPILTGERSAINLIQTLSGTATSTNQYVKAVEGTGAKILDTRKTIPGLRTAQKWAVRCGGGHNHRHGLYDGVLIKENHIRSSNSITETLRQAKAKIPADTLLCIEVENLDELKLVLDAGAQRILLDNFSIESLREAVNLNQDRAELEASGGITLDNIHSIATTGVHYISIGAITKNIQAVDYSLLFT